MRNLRTLHEYIIKQLASDQERASGYLQAALEDYQTHGNPAVFLLALQTVVESQGGISEIAKQIEIHPKTLLDILNSDEFPRVEMLSAILNTLGCQIRFSRYRSIYMKMTDISMRRRGVSTPDISIIYDFI